MLLIQTYSRSYIFSCTYRGIFAHIRAYFSRFRHIQDPCITSPNSVNQYLLFKSSASFKSLFKAIWNIFFIFVSKVDIQNFVLQDNNSNSNNNMAPTLVHHSTTHASTPSTLLMLHLLARHSR